MTEHESRYLSNNGRLFFDGAGALVAQDQAPTRQETVNGKTLNVGVENVYEYEPGGIGSCQQASGCVALISSGTSERESAFLDASEGGGGAFFLTAAKLVAQDTEPGYEVYAAAECGTSETPACLPDKLPPPEECTGEGCRAPAGAPSPAFRHRRRTPAPFLATGLLHAAQPKKHHRKPHQAHAVRRSSPRR